MKITIELTQEEFEDYCKDSCSMSDIDIAIREFAQDNLYELAEIKVVN